MKNLNALRDEIYAINKENGWHEDKRTFGELIALVHSEVSEALEDYRNGKKIDEVWYEYKCSDGTIDIGYIPFLIDVYENVILGKPCGIPSELADIVIRILDICGIYGWDIEKFYNAHTVEYRDKKPFGSLLSNIHLHLSLTYNAGNDTHINEYHVVISFFGAITLVEYICYQNEINLDQIIQEKLEYNKTRGYKHGGKVI